MIYSEGMKNYRLPDIRSAVQEGWKAMSEKLPGVYEARQKDGTLRYRSSITHKGKHISLGSYTSSGAAHTAYCTARQLLSDASLTLHSYQAEACVLPFDKWVVLLNFRDNGLYFANPIYLRQKYFEYYLSPNTVLRFDRDDLFYYSSHRIMRRGRHFFVADYGMQVNIANRYGIKNYAVENRDYRFINGNPLDFRYENIEILNPYHGVRIRNTKDGIRYAAVIHLNGNYTIGIYERDIEAAIAYNKAIDILKKNGVSKSFTPNYLENLLPSAYADIYSGLKISSKIRNYHAT